MSQDPFDLSGRRALVTGSSRGIGRGIALALAAQGTSVCVHFATRREEADAVAAEIAAAGGQAVVAGGDVSVPGACRRIAAEAAERLGGPVDVLVANAGIELREAFADVTWDAARAQFDANLMGTLELVQAVTPAMTAQGWGRIVTIGSVQQVRPHPKAMVYAALKSALANVVRNLALQLAGSGVTVNNIAPGVIETDRNAAALADPAYRDWVKGRIPMGVFGAPADCGGACVLMCSEAGRYITGTDLMVDGGMHLG